MDRPPDLPPPDFVLDEPDECVSCGQETRRMQAPEGGLAFPLCARCETIARQEGQLPEAPQAPK